MSNTLILCSILDSATRNYGPPLCARTPEEAIRVFKQMCNDVNNRIVQSPADYTLFGIAYFDMETGVIVPFDSLSNLGNAAQYVVTDVNTKYPSIDSK